MIILFDILSCPGAFLVLRLSMVFSIIVVVMVSLCFRQFGDIVGNVFISFSFSFRFISICSLKFEVL